MNLNKNKSAVVLIEFQNQWTEKGLYHWLIKGQLKSRNVLENTRIFVKNARKEGINIIHAPLIIDPENKKGWLAYLTFGKVFTKDTGKSKITKGLYETGDIIVKGRYTFDAFTGSNLEQILKESQIKNLFFCGFTTDQCIAKTMKTALEKRFGCYLISDCTAAMNSFLQKKTENRFQGKVFSYQEILDMAGKCG